MKLYDVPNKTNIRIIEDPNCPPDTLPVEKDEIIFFDHIDGMYSYCTNQEGDVVHLAAWTEVEVV